MKTLVAAPEQGVKVWLEWQDNTGRIHSERVTLTEPIVAADAFGEVQYDPSMVRSIKLAGD